MRIRRHKLNLGAMALVALAAISIPALCQSQAAKAVGRDPEEGEPTLPVVTYPSGRVTMADVDENALRSTIHELVSCGTRLSTSSWTDPQHGIGCARDKVLARFRKIARASGGRLEVNVDRFEASVPRHTSTLIHLENVVAILPGSDPNLRKVAFVVSGHYDSRPSGLMDAASDAPGADDDASGVAVSIESARLLTTRGPLRATLVFAAVSGEEQGLLGGKELLSYLRQRGYEIGGMLDNDIVGADFTPGALHRVRLFSQGCPEGADPPSRELARAIEEIDGQNEVRLIFRVDRLGRGGDHMPFVDAGLPAVRFTEPLEDYHHEHQTPRTEGGVVFGDLEKFLNFRFMASVARDNAEALRELALAPAPPENVTLSGAVTPDAKISFMAPEDNDRAGFEVLWRETTAPRWSGYRSVAKAGEVVLQGVSTDNHFFAVRSVGRNQARSIGVPAILAPLRPPPAR